MPEILPNPFTDPAKLPKRSLFDFKKDEQRSFIDQAMAQGLEAAQTSVKKEFTDPELQNIWDNIEEKIQDGEIKIHEITIGGKTNEQLINQIEAAGIKIDEYVKEMMENPAFKTSKTEKDIEMIDISVEDLGLQKCPTREKIFQRAKELGLEIAPAEAGPQLSLQYPEQTKGLVIGMEPLEVSSGDQYLFVVSHGPDGRVVSSASGNPNLKWRTNYMGDPGAGWTATGRFVFVRPLSLRAAKDGQSK